MRSRLTRRFVLFVALAAVLPLMIYGVVSVSSLWEGTRASVRAGNYNVATRAAEQIALYISDSVNVLRAVGSDLRDTHLEPWQQDRIVKNYVLTFPEFREITLFNADGTVVTSRLGRPTVSVPAPDRVRADGTAIAPLKLDNDLLPTTTVAIRLSGPDEPAAWLVGSLSLEELWRMVDSIRIGQQGYAMLVSDENQLIAHGDPDEKRLIARGEGVPDAPLLDLLRNGRERFLEYTDHRDRQVLAAAAPVPGLGWTVIVEQPTAEAYAVAYRLEWQLLVVIGVALLATIVAGYLWGRSVLRRIFALMRGTRALAEGRLDERVSIGGKDEIQQLGQAFNTMAERLEALQADVRRQERQAMFGRVASGLAHDLSTPIMNVGNSCKLIVRMWDDEEYRETFRRTVDRELLLIKQMLDDLRNVAKPAVLARQPVDLNRSAADVIESMRTAADDAKVELVAALSNGPLVVDGDVTALSRVYRNLIANAVQATQPGGHVTVETQASDGRAILRISDTGCGIDRARLDSIFDDFVTTKHRGLGLGLAVTKRIVEQLDGVIGVDSEVGRGTTFTLDFPALGAHGAHPAPGQTGSSQA